jgi:hypothetical protein
MEIIKTLKDVRVFRDDDGVQTAQKGTTCKLVQDGRQRYVEKSWVSGDWVFPGDYEYGVEKRVYNAANELGLPAPALIDCDDVKRTLLIEFIEGEPVQHPCSNERHLLAVLGFFDAFRQIAFSPSVQLYKMDGEAIHKYRLDRLQFRFPEDDVWQRIDSLYESFLKDIPYCSLPFDGILKNTIASGDGLVFIDFEWTIAGPHEFTLARTAVEFNEYEHSEILSRVEYMDLYHLFLLRFYMYGREPELVHAYLRANLRDTALCELLDIINVHSAWQAQRQDSP